MNCWQCASIIPPEVKFCAYCGASQAKKCWNCQEELADTESCTFCGVPRGVTVEEDIRDGVKRVVTGKIGREEITIIFDGDEIKLIDRG